MRRFLLFLLFGFFYLSHQSVIAQACSITNAKIELVGAPVTEGTNCVITFNLSFDQLNNGGFKWQYIYLWLAADYPPLSFYGNGKQTPTVPSVNNSKAVATIITDYTQTLTLNQYQGNATVPTSLKANLPVTVQETGTGSATVRSYTISNIKVTIPGGCAQQINIKGDLLGYNNVAANTAQCLTREALTFSLNDPILAGVKNCEVPRTVSFSIETKSLLPINFSYRLFADDGDGIPEVDAGGQDLAVSAESAFSTLDTDPSTAAPNKVTFTGVSYDGNGVGGAYGDRDIYLVVRTSETTVDYVRLLQYPSNVECALLPVKLSTFSATRGDVNKSEIALNWSTAQEQNNRGFNLQRKTGGQWQSIAFVPSAAPGGNANQELRYSYKDQNNFPGVSQYRLLQMDLDDRKTYSKEVAVRGISQNTPLTIYPNPGINGTVTLLFGEGSSTREVLVNDMNGRLIKRFRNVAGNTLPVTGLPPGFYTVRVNAAGRSEPIVEKVIIK